MIKYLCSFLLFVFCILQANASPDELYNSAWKLLDEKFYDKSMNGQDWSKWKEKYKNMNTYEDSYLAINTMVESLNDPYTIFLKPYSYKEEVLSMAGKSILLGIYITNEKDKYFISPIKDSAAQKAGIKKHDRLLAINDMSTENMSPDELLKLLTVNDGDKIRISVKRKGSQNIIFNLTAEEQNVESIFHTPPYKCTKIPGNIKYIRITSFMDRNIAKNFKEIVETSDANTDGYIIDLRNNTGGIAKNAAVMANMLLKNAEIISIIGRNGDKKVITANQYILTTKPIVVLVNGNTASASEIFTAAMQDNKRAIIIGEKTFGKGIMQDKADLPYGCGINITVKRYLTPSGKFIHGQGIEPDIKIKMKHSDYIFKNDIVLKHAIKILTEK